MKNHQGMFLRCVLLFAILAVMAFYRVGMAAVSQGGATEERAYFPPVLMYHDMKETPDNYFDVTVEDFRTQLDWLQAEGYKTLSMEEFVAVVKSGEPFPENAVLITFDDGYRGIYDFAAPELKKRGMKATFFIIVNSLGKKDYITEAELLELAAEPLFSIGSHTLTHPHLEQLKKNKKQKEISRSRELLAAKTERRIDALAFPYGGYDKSVIRAAQEAGYAVTFAVQDRGLLHEPARYSIPRIFMGLELGKDYMDTFSEYVRNYKTMPAAAFAERWEPMEKN